MNMSKLPQGKESQDRKSFLFGFHFFFFWSLNVLSIRRRSKKKTKDIKYTIHMRMSAYEHEHKHKQDYSNNMRKKLKSCLSHKKKLIRLRSFYLSWEFIQMEARFCGMKEKRDRTAFLICIIAARTFHHFMLKKITLVWLCMRMHEINLWYKCI